MLNVRCGGEPVGRWLSEAAEAGEPFRLTLRQLTSSPVLPWALDIFVCASAALVRAAADELGPQCPALVCTEGEPSVACARLLQAAAGSGSAVHWHADFSWPGLHGTAAAIQRLSARPWRMAAADFQEARRAAVRPSGAGRRTATGTRGWLSSCSGRAGACPRTACCRPCSEIWPLTRGDELLQQAAGSLPLLAHARTRWRRNR